MPLPLIAAAAMQALPAVGTIAAMVPGPMEMAMRRQAKGEAKRLAGTGGGLSQGELTRAQAAANAANTAAQEAAQANLARSASMLAPSGRADAAALNLAAAGQGAQQQALSDLREMDLRKKVADQAALQSLRQGLVNQRNTRFGLGATYWQTTQPTQVDTELLDRLGTAGASSRDTLAAKVNSATASLPIQ